MNLFAHMDTLHTVAGLLVGLLVGLTGVGGGSLMTPLLVLMFGVNPQTAVGTDLLFAASTKAIGSAVHGWRETVDWRIVRRLASGSIPAALLTLAILAHVGPIAKSTQHVLLVVLGVMLALTAITVLFQKKLIAYARRRSPIEPAAKAIIPTILLGAVIGGAVSLTSVGAGAIGVTALLMLYPGLPIARIVGSDIAHAVPLAAVAGFGHWYIGDVNTALLANLLLGSIPGVIVGSIVSSRAPDRVLRPLLVIVLTLSAWQLMQKAYTRDKAGSAQHLVKPAPKL
jgi:uncharacterized membrane protein YfcA